MRRFGFCLTYFVARAATAGQERYQSLGSAFYRGADACVLVYSITEARSLDTLLSWRDEFLIAAAPRDPETYPFIVLGNKVDVTDKAREVSARRARDWCATNGGLPLFETSAQDDINVDAAFEIAVQKALARLNEEPQDLYVSQPYHARHLRSIVIRGPPGPRSRSLTFECILARLCVGDRIIGDTVEINRLNRKSGEGDCAC